MERKEEEEARQVHSCFYRRVAGESSPAGNLQQKTNILVLVSKQFLHNHRVLIATGKNIERVKSIVKVKLENSQEKYQCRIFWKSILSGEFLYILIFTLIIGWHNELT